MLQGNDDRHSFRLSKDFLPEAYKMNIAVDMENLKYLIDYAIDLTVQTDNPPYAVLYALTSYYAINQIELLKFNVQSGIYDSQGPAELIQSDNINDIFTQQNETVFILINFPLISGDKIKAHISIEGRIPVSTEKKLGLYLTTHRSSQNDIADENDIMIKHCTAACINEPCEARCIFPCFDEPCFKSTFTVNVILQGSYVRICGDSLAVLSNEALSEIVYDQDEDKYTYKFQETPLMPVYLLTFVVGNFKCFSSDMGRTKLRVFAPIGSNVEDYQFTLDFGQKCLNFFEDFCQQPYSFSKLDLVSLHQPEVLAIECWGCILFESDLLSFEKSIRISDCKFNEKTIAHEISHSWFGNLVTMLWWNDLWINEGFAKLMEFLCLDALYPEYNIWDNYFSSTFLSALLYDESDNAPHPLRAQVPHARKTEELFDTVTYSKGASVLQMLSHYIGKDKFIEVIRGFLKTFQYKNATCEDLWCIFNSVTGLNIGDVMDSWVSLSGHPKVTCQVDCENSQWCLKLVQSKFQKKNLTSKSKSPIWKIPLFIKTSNCEYNLLMDEETLTLNLEDTFHISYDELLTGKNFIKINSDMKGFYRVCYNSQELWTALFKQRCCLTKYDISGLIIDYMSDYSSFMVDEAFYILENIRPIDDYLILLSARLIFCKLIQLWENEQVAQENILQTNSTLVKTITCKKSLMEYFSQIVQLDKEEAKKRAFADCDNVTVGRFQDKLRDEYIELALHYHIDDTDLVSFFICMKDLSKVMNKNMTWIISEIIKQGQDEER